MPKVAENVPVKVTVSKMTLEVPKSFFDQAALRAAIFVGRKGRSAATRRTKWFTLADPSLVPSRTRQSVALPTSHLRGSQRGSMVVEDEAAGGEQHHVEETPVEMAVLEYSGINTVVYDVDMRPLNIFEGDWVFDQKTTHPMTVFAKILVKNRPGARGGGGKSELESNLNEMLQMDQDDMESDEDESDGFSNEHDDGGAHDDDSALSISLTGVNLTEAQMTALKGTENPNEVVMNQLRRAVDCKKRYLQFPKAIDVATIVNTKAKTADFCERLMCKNAALLGSTLSFTVAAELPLEKLSKFEDKAKSKEDKEEIKRREKEEKGLEKERKKEEKEEKKRREKEEKKSGKKEDKVYGTDITDAQNPSGAKNEPKSLLPNAASQQQPTTPEGSKKKKSGFPPLDLVKGLFTKEEKPEQATPFTVKLTSTPYPFLVMLYDFQLSKLVMEPVNYRAVHIRLGTDAPSTEDFPRLLLDTTKPNTQTESTITWYDGSTRNVTSFHFDHSRIFFGDKAIRHITGFATLRALQEHERQYHEAKKAAPAESNSPHRESADNDLFREQLMNVGTQFQPITFAPTKYSTNGNQALATKFTRVTAQLIVAENVVGEVHPSDAAEKEAFVHKLKKEQKQKKKEEKDRVKAEKEAEKAAKKAEKKKDDAAAAADAESSRNTSPEADNAASTATTMTSASSKIGEENHADDGAEGKEKADDAEGGEEDKPTFEAGGEDRLEASEAASATPEAGKKDKKEKHEKDGAKIVLNQSNSFQLSTYVMNEDFIPQDGLQYHILFQTGEELTFRARRFFLPSVCSFGDEGCTRETTLNDYLNSAEE
ncbi:hypothetical protein ABB37_09887 [Leptomonas pyrrhocoris]|uniref:Uncharacterized protein n=1 Tax=Leptomonas pyrrhocoris TaxID=157538 RepID=A0A0M9FPN0_LEPPY|nr:hypothetical protein ABB37_09887 [Leptomonas pyrrhocoris]KPA73447.1 hypothetical protein ABB37_09887 [Leptomonas pyrrhocoris]|eukprot:XP_015651886.1 hypothetical protein ABB37_09887 [Leptomonas pyrrhocoris]